MRVDTPGAFVLFAASIIAACGTAQTANRSDAAATSFTPVFNGGVNPANDCWARLYERKDFQGRSLSISGPAQIANLPPYLGLPWEGRYASLVVGSTAALGLFEGPNLHDETAMFRGAMSVRDLDKAMGVFRRIRSVQVTCVK